MYVELLDGVCCNIVTANTHIGISILRAKYYVPKPSTVGVKLNLQPNNRFMIEYSVSKISQKVFSFLCVTLLHNICSEPDKNYTNGCWLVLGLTALLEGERGKKR